FFPNFDPLVGTLLAYTTFFVGFISRPIGGIIFGHYGDRIGRKTVLVLTILIMGVATFLIGLLPTYASVGIGAPIGVPAGLLLSSGMVYLLSYLPEADFYSWGWRIASLTSAARVGVAP